jgi:hypothetical protein
MRKQFLQPVVQIKAQASWRELLSASTGGNFDVHVVIDPGQAHGIYRS